MSKMFLLCAEDSAPAVLINPAVGGMVRKSEGLLFTDDVGVIKDEGDYLWLGDSDSTIACLTKDLVTMSRRDLGYYSQTAAGQPKMFQLQGNYLYVLNTRKRDGGTISYDPVNESQLTIIKHDKYTLQYVSEVVLADVLFWDDANKLPLLDSSTYIWAGTHVWVKNQANWDWYKIDIATGALADTWTEAGGAPQWSPGWANSTGSKVLAPFTWESTEVLYANFLTKTTGSTPLNLGAAAEAAGAFPAASQLNTLYDVITGERARMPYVDDANNKIYFMVNSTGVGGGPVATNFMVELNWMTGATVFSQGIVLDIVPPDADRLPAGMTHNYTNLINFAPVSPTVGFGFDTGLTVMIDFATGVVTPALVGPMQGYANNGNYWRGTAALEIPQVVLTGLVKNKDTGAPLVGVSVFLFDQEKAEKIAESITDGQGRYTFHKHTSREYMVVCVAPDNTLNYKVKARM